MLFTGNLKVYETKLYIYNIILGLLIIYNIKNANQNEPKVGPGQFMVVVTKSLWSSPNPFGQTKTVLAT